MLCTIADLKKFLELSATDQDDLFTQIIDAVSIDIASYCGRKFKARNMFEYGSWAEYFSFATGTRMLTLTAWPVVAVSEVRYNLSGVRDDDDEDTLLAADDYIVDSDSGKFWVDFVLRGVKALKVTYTGGFLLADDWSASGEYVAGDYVAYGDEIYQAKGEVSGVTPPSDDTDNWTLTTITPVPDDLRRAATMQAAHLYRRRSELGSNSQSASDGNVSFTGQYDLLDNVKRMIESYVRYF